MAKLFVGNVSYDATENDLMQLAQEQGIVATKAIIILDRDTGRSRGFGFLEIDSDADDAIMLLNGQELGGRTLTVNEARPKEDRPNSGGSQRGRNGGGRRDRY